MEVAASTTIDNMADCTHAGETETKLSAAQKVFSTYELSEAIIMLCNSEDLPAISMVNRALHQTSRSDKIWKQLLCSDFFFKGCTKCYTRRDETSYLVYPKSTTALSVSVSRPPSAFIKVLKFRQREVIVVKRYQDFRIWKRAAVVLSGGEDVPGLTSEELVTLRGGWFDAIVESARLENDGGFVARFGRGVLQLVQALPSTEVVM